MDIGDKVQFKFKELIEGIIKDKSGEEYLIEFESLISQSDFNTQRTCWYSIKNTVVLSKNNIIKIK